MSVKLKDSIKKMIQAHRTGHNEEFTAAVREVIAQERGRGHNRVADDLERALANGFKPADRQTKALIMARNPGVDPMIDGVPLSRGDQFPLLEVRQPKQTFDDIILNLSAKTRLDRIIDEHAHRADLAKYGLQPLNKILFYGPPGCGKTLAAHVISNALGWPMLYVRFDSVISSYLGETSSNLRRVFDFANDGPSVLLFDEFDAIGKSRDASNEVGELKRVVNSFLQLMDNYHGKGIVIAATNHEGLLDFALWRRFDEVVHFAMPSAGEISELLQLRLGNVRQRDFVPRTLVSHFEGLSFGDITRICIDAVKRMVLAGRSQITKQDVLDTLVQFRENRPES